MAPGIKVDYNYVSWFCVLFLIASYIRFYGLPIKENWGGYFLLSVLVSMASVGAIGLLRQQFNIPIPAYWLVSDSYAIMAVVTSVCGLMYFKDLKMPQSKIVNTVAQSVFGVLLIHANSDTMRKWLWQDTVDVVGQYQSTYSILYAIITVVIIFAVCVIIDQIRIRFIEQPLFRFLDNRWLNKGEKTQ